MDDGVKQLSPGMMCFIYPNQVHSIDRMPGPHAVYDVIKMDVNQFSDSPSYAPPMRVLLR